jgi:cytochrome c oxidase assembly protein subunit 15
MSVGRSMSPAAYTRICWTALVLLCTIVVTGAAVRLTGSGLGCSDWPQCNSEKFIDVSTGHGAIEQVNRLFTGFVAAGVIAAVLAARRRSPYRRDLVVLSWGLVIGVLAQVVLGGIVVLTGLHPLANMGHFALSMVLVANALVLVRRSAQPDGGCPVRTVDPSQNRLIRLVVVLGTMAVVTGTVVTGTGPHAGDEEAPRFGFDISHVARIHGIAVIATLVACLALAVKLRRNLVHKAPVTALEGVVAIGFVQAAIGYVQYFNGVPALLVGFHILGATLFFLALVNLWTSATQIVDNRDNVARNSVMV